jgi:hypothetical protein
MIFYTGQGYLIPLLLILPFIVIGAILYYVFGFDVLRTPSWWPLHSMIVLGAILVFVTGRRLNRQKVQEVTYEKSGPVTVLRPRHTLYWIPMEYWSAITLIVYFGIIAYCSFRFS